MKLENKNAEILVHVIYAKCTPNKILVLWEYLGELSNNIEDPWIVGGL